MTTITRYRGDTVPDQMAVVDDGVVKDLTGISFRLTVSSLEGPGSREGQIFQVQGIKLDASGIVQFTPSLSQVDQPPGTYYYDIQLITPQGFVLTIAKGEYVIEQDITKEAS